MYLHYIIDKDDFDLAGEASSKVKKALTQLGINPVTIKKAAISMYEAEINAFIHGGGGDAFVDIDKDRIKIVIEDHGNNGIFFFKIISIFLFSFSLSSKNTLYVLYKIFLSSVGILLSEHLIFKPPKSE